MGARFVGLRRVSPVARWASSASPFPWPSQHVCEHFVHAAGSRGARCRVHSARPSDPPIPLAVYASLLVTRQGSGGSRTLSWSPPQTHPVHRPQLAAMREAFRSRRAS